MNPKYGIALYYSSSKSFFTYPRKLFSMDGVISRIMNVHSFSSGHVNASFNSQLDKNLLKRYFAEHPNSDLPDFADKVNHLLKQAIAGCLLICLRYPMMGINCPFHIFATIFHLISYYTWSCSWCISLYLFRFCVPFCFDVLILCT